MKPQQILMILLIVLGAVTGSTLATVTYLRERQSAQTTPNRLSKSLSADRTSIFRDTSEPEATALTEQNASSQPKSNDFAQFQLRLLEAVRRRDANFIRAIATAQTQWSRNGKTNVSNYKIDEAKSPFWQYLEKAVKAGCTVEPNTRIAEQEPGSEVWVCPETSGKPIYTFGWQEQVAILGQNVNVRSEPGIRGRRMGTLSKQIVPFDSQTYSNLSQEVKELVNTPDGWTPVVLPDGKPGWVQNSFVYYEPRDFRVSFVRSRGRWRLRYFLSGDGN